MSVAQSDILMEQDTSRFKSGYFYREIDRANEASKQPIREAVLAYILANHAPGRMRFFGMPGERWCFERQLQASWKSDCRVIGVEREMAIFRRAIGWMPKEWQRPYWIEHPTKLGAVTAIKTDTATLFHGELSHLIQISSRDQTKSNRTKWAGIFKGWTAIWLDFTSMLYFDIEKILPRVGRCCDLGRQDVPIAITLTLGREKADVLNKLFALDTDRDGFVSRLLDSGNYRSFTFDKSMKYRSDAGSNMMVVFGRLEYRQLVL